MLWPCWQSRTHGSVWATRRTVGDTRRAVRAVERDPSGIHALSHLDAALTNLNEFDLDGTERDIVEWALWFHDAIYDPTAADNEERSAVLAEEQIDHHLPDSMVAEIARLVRLTAGHVVEAGDQLGGIMIDVDLSILGAPADAYDEYTVGVRREYNHRGDDDFREGRGTFLEGMLDRSQIFNTARGIELWEIRTRTNLVRELARYTP